MPTRAIDDGSQQVNLRCTQEEFEALEGTAIALGATKSTFIAIALQAALGDLRVLVLTSDPPRLRPGFQWRWLLPTSRGPAKNRITTYVPHLIYPAVAAAANAVRTSIPRFCIGSGLGLVVEAIELNHARKAKPQRAGGAPNPALEGIRVPHGLLSPASVGTR